MGQCFYLEITLDAFSFLSTQESGLCESADETMSKLLNRLTTDLVGEQISSHIINRRAVLLIFAGYPHKM